MSYKLTPALLIACLLGLGYYLFTLTQPASKTLAAAGPVINAVGKNDQSATPNPQAIVGEEIISPTGANIQERFGLPPGFERVSYPATAFGTFLRNFPLKPHGTAVKLFDGQLKRRQDVHAAVLDIDTGKRDLQQCADAVMRLWSEYLWQANRADEISFNFTNGFPATYRRWQQGERIRVNGNNVSWVGGQAASSSYASFRAYLNMVFAYAGTLSLAKELQARPLAKLAIGDVFIQGGSPGHALIIVDHAINPGTGEVLILLAQSYMPAQDIHVLKNLHNPLISPWYTTSDFPRGVRTPEWHFEAKDLRFFQ